ncbi:transcription-repair coupling factor [Bailinhaonella thermotolerans]|uniref:Transcription-repair-coupling factor n=1 Tax=Bailinhaonella thermotolerans TaxID=1070861 RepID=A0A3A4AUN3_9ACTN|nr:transcription-repair coupling factor [Bailinhaonella thermotolerans]RJL33295.1 transcription-repair coupling factor [Bailinhaonella thermotolerans]
MSLTGLLDLLLSGPTADPALVAALEPVRERLPDADADLVAPQALRPFAAAVLADGERGAGRPVLAITATGREAEDLASALTSLLPPESVALFPAWETLPHERLSPRSDTVGQRLAVLRRLAHPQPDDPAAGPVSVVVAPVRAVLQPIVSGLGDLTPVRLRAQDDADLDDVVRRLVEAGYHRVDMVEKRGEVAVRGGLLDVFPPTEEHPLRVEFWGDTVEEIRWFKVADQRSLEVAEQGLFAPPCRELLLTPEVRERARELAAEHPALAEVLDQMADGSAVEGMEAFAPVLADRMELLLDNLPAGACVLLCDPERVRGRSEELVRTSQEFLEASWVNAAAGGEAPIDLGGAAFRDLAEIREYASGLGMPWWTISPLDSGEEAARLDVSAAENYRGDTARALGDVKGWIGENRRVVLVTAGPGPAERLVEVLKGEDVAARLRVPLDETPEPGVVYVSTGRIEHGFTAPGLAVLTESDLVGQKSSTKDMRRLPSRRRNMVDPLQLRAGDYVVHEQHGVGRYIEMVQRTVQGATREYLVIEYAKGDRLFVPTDQLDEVTRYVGGEAPTLNRMGGADWAKAKSRARKAVRQIAGELIRLYSARMASPGFAFSPDTPWQRELEDAFPYAETGDQLAAIDEVKSDMEKPVPMDRLICGDVGYGKTEIAVRAAFKAVQDGKQVAVLVPTTLLVQQHLSTFSERFSSFPIVIRPMSRFQTDAEVKATMEGLRDGSIDVVIGTHRLLSGEVRFKDLGLIIVDEEQRFGVEHKEAMKHLRTQVDVLAMSATPIPRTLEMGLTGIREMSTILTPPEERHPILTFVGPYDERQIAAAIRRELMRDGQVFFVHNRVKSIDKVAARLKELVPEARVAVAHGQMNEHQLEQIMVDFWENKHDVLVSTTIVESGLDVPNANTLIVDRADNYGLSQLHQLRGRVGRGRERGYAYFLYPPEKPLTETAHERLATIAQHTEMGAGMFVAMKDLEIRGAGNILGAEQSGHIAGVGFDLYVRMVGEAVRELKGQGPAEQPEVRVELPINAHIPHDYAPGERLRLEAYKRIAAITSDEEVLAVRDELKDRYGPPPEAVDNLLEVARFRARARQAGLTDVVLQGQHIRFGPVDLRESQQVRLQRLYPKSILKAATNTLLVPVPKTKPLGGQPLRDLALLKWCTDLVDALFLEPARMK